MREMRNAYKVFVGKPEGMRLHVRRRHIIRMVVTNRMSICVLDFSG
jgi:hypothetical protein